MVLWNAEEMAMSDRDQLIAELAELTKDLPLSGFEVQLSLMETGESPPSDWEPPGDGSDDLLFLIRDGLHRGQVK